MTDIRVVREFAQVFPKEVLGLPPNSKVEFCIDVFKSRAICPMVLCWFMYELSRITCDWFLITIDTL